MADGAVKFVTNSIDVGDQSQPTLTPEQLTTGQIASPYGLWGALGTVMGKDKVESDF